MRPGRKYDIIVNYTRISLTQSSSCHVSTSGRVYDDFVLLLFLHAHREANVLAGELPQESDRFRFLRAARLANLKGSLGLIFTMRGAIGRQSLHNEGYYSHRFVYAAFHTSPSIL